jgi:hypothetical protein
MLKFITLLISYFMGKFNASGSESSIKFLTAALIQKTRKIALLFGIITLASIGLSLSLMKAIQDAGAWFEKNYVMNFSPGFFLALIGAAGFFALFLYATSEARWTEKDEDKPQETKHSVASPFEEAISLLIMDFVREREFNREKKQTQEAAANYVKTNTNAAYTQKTQ